MAEGAAPLVAGAGHFRLLLDTNAFIALEPTSTAPESGLAIGAELLRLSSAGGHRLFLQEAINRDIDRDRDSERRDTHHALTHKYEMLGRLEPSATLLTALGEAAPPAPASNDGVDLEFLAALDAGAIDYLVTDDVRLRRRAVRAGLGEFVVTLAEAVALLRNLLPREVPPPPAVDEVRAYQLNVSDPIFDSLREDYPGFDAWLAKAKGEHRRAWIIKDPGSLTYAAVMLVKQEEPGDFGLPGRVLKVSTLKVAEDALGRKYGELMLKTLFAFAHAHAVDTVYVTVFEKHAALVDLLETFGFEAQPGRSGLGEQILVKWRRPVESAGRDCLTTHRRHGPPFVDPRSPVFLVPIQPIWHELLFPDYGSGLPIWTGEHPYGNALRKAYVSKSPTHLVTAGTTLLFYRSEDTSAATAVGVVDAVLEDPSPEAILRFVGRRTVYTLGDLRGMADGGGRLHAMLFRQDRLIEPAWRLRELQRARVVKSWPQSITKVGEEGTRWVHQQLGESH